WPARRRSINIRSRRRNRSNWGSAAISVAVALTMALNAPLRRSQAQPGRHRKETGAMAEDKWPEQGKRQHLGRRTPSCAGPDTVPGRAKYSYDSKRPEMLFGKILRSPCAHAKIVSIDASAAEKMPGVKTVKVINGPGFELQWAGQEIVAVAAVDEPTAEDAV